MSTFRIYRLEAKYELLKLLRLPVFIIPSIGFPRYARFLSDFWSDHPQANRLGSLLTFGHVNGDALGLC